MNVEIFRMMFCYHELKTELIKRDRKEGVRHSTKRIIFCLLKNMFSVVILKLFPLDQSRFCMGLLILSSCIKCSFIMDYLNFYLKHVSLKYY